MDVSIKIPPCDNKDKPEINIQLHDYDTWSLDVTLAHIIVPCLQQLKDTAHSYMSISDDDVPEELRTGMTMEEENDGEHEHGLPKYYWVMDAMIWSFTQIRDHNFDYQEEINMVEFVKHEERIDHGVYLFGKYYRGLWD